MLSGFSDRGEESNAKGARAFYDLTRHSALESLSGLGSSLVNTVEIRAFLPQLFSSFSIQSFVDCPCGDWNWMREVDLEGIQYIGLDIIPEIIDRNRERYGSPMKSFQVFDAIQSVPPKADLILCRDFLFHLSLPHIERVIGNFRASGSRLLLTTTFPTASFNNELSPSELAVGWGWRKINAEHHPIGLGEPLAGVRENATCKFREVRLYQLTR